MRRSRATALAAALLIFAVALPLCAQTSRTRAVGRLLHFAGEGKTFFGTWQAGVSMSMGAWSPGAIPSIEVELSFGSDDLAQLAATGVKADKLCLLVTAERSFDADGWMRLPSDERMSTLLVGLRPGAALELGGTFRPAFQIDPLLPVAIRFDLTYPDGRTQTAEGTADRFGSFAGAAAWPLDRAGVYRYRITGNWNGFGGGMPGLPNGEGEFYVYTPRPAGVTGLRVDGASHRTFAATTGLTITGTSSATTVHYAVITPGAVIEIGDLEVRGGKFQYVFDPAAVHRKVPLYDIESITTGKPQIGRVVHITFCAEEKGPSGSYFDVTRVILRGTTAITARPAER